MTEYLNYADIVGAMDSIVELEKAITADVSGILGIPFNNEALPYSRQQGSVYPKWLNGLSDTKPEEWGLGQQYDPVVIRIELQVGKITEGYQGELEQQLYTWIPYTLATFRVFPRLQSEARPESPRGLLDSFIRLSRPLMPGDVIAAEFLLTLACFVMNAGT